jgi:putative hydrolase of the HAD superfamily
VLKAIAFDLWETLITNNPEVSVGHGRYRIERLERVLTSRGHAADARQIERAYRNVWTRCQELYWSADVDIPCRRQIEVFIEELGVDPENFGADTLDEMERVYANAAVDLLPEVVPGARELLEEVRRRGLRTGLISNTGRTPGYALREILNRLDLSRYIEVMVFSNEHGVCKPQPSIFESLRKALDVRYDELLFIGDNLYVDVYGAKRCGMQAVHFAPQTRGTAVAPAVAVEVEADATVERLQDVREWLERIKD